MIKLQLKLNAEEIAFLKILWKNHKEKFGFHILFAGEESVKLQFEEEHKFVYFVNNWFN